MDGYAVVSADTAGAHAASPARLRLVDQIFTGQISAVTVGSGSVRRDRHRRATSPGADAVVMVEETAIDGRSHPDSQRRAVPGANIGRRGADIMTGDSVVHAGDRLTPSRIGALAAIGCASVATVRKAGRRDSLDRQ